jgi:putative membrane-bound dehydrogenase-like protein
MARFHDEVLHVPFRRREPQRLGAMLALGQACSRQREHGTQVFSKRPAVAPFLALVALAVLASSAAAQALSPEEALKHFKTAEGFDVELFAAEPLVRQPVTITFDDRGRMWVIQYLQYPNPAGLRPVEVDRYLRTKYDRVPEPPPHGPQGKDKITILEDTDGDGRVDRAKDFVTGLNLASALALGNGGVYVGQAPYLLFYPDRNRDDVPDGDPEVLLSGFGMEDAHAVVNSLQFGPDGWLYGAQGSTVTADIRGIGFQQGIWRYHPATRRFELFSEGGGNTWGLDFDRHGNAIAGTNFGHSVCLHQVQGGYYVKGFAKHGPLHNPYTYGYFEHVTHAGHVGGHVTCGGIVYQGGDFPDAFHDAYIGPNLLSNAVYWSAIEPDGSTFKTRFVGTLLETDDVWFRPIDCLAGPDGALYVADWYDRRANHVIPEDTWDKSNGRIWRVVRRGAKPPKEINLAALPTDRLVDRLESPNAWHRREARRILSERRDPTSLPHLRRLLAGDNEQLALEGLWALYTSGGFDEETVLSSLVHASVDVRAWTVRIIGDERRAPPREVQNRLVQMAEKDPSPTVRSQLAASAKRLPAADGLAIVDKLMRRAEDGSDPHIPLLIWWAIEDKASSDPDRVLKLFADGQLWLFPIAEKTVVERLARRFLAERTDGGYAACARLLALAPRSEDLGRMLTAIDQDFSGRPLDEVPPPLAATVAQLWKQDGASPIVTRFALRMGSREAYESALARMMDPAEPQKVRTSLITAVGQAGRHDALPGLLALLDEASPEGDAVRSSALAALAHYVDPSIGTKVLARYGDFSAPLRASAIALAAGRAPWSFALVDAVESGAVDPKDVSIERLRAMLAHDDARLARAIERRWGKIRPATPGEKMSYVPVLGRVLNAGEGNLENGHQLYMKHCGVCHTLHGEGQKIGPDLTAADRKNRDALLIGILDPSGTIRPEFVSQTAVLNDGRVLTGLIVESTDDEITIVDAKQQKTTISRDEIDQLQPSETSLMPERLLETLAEQEVRDLFRYLQSDGPQARAAAKSD